MSQFWWLAIAGVVMSLMGLIIFDVTVKRLRGKSKTYLGLMVFSLTLYLLGYSAPISVFGLIDLDINNVMWQAIQPVFLVSTILFAASNVGLMVELNKLYRRHKKGKK